MSLKSPRAPLPKALAQPPSGRVLLLAPHADDDILGPGGTLCLHRDAGDPVKVVVLYNGIAGSPSDRYSAEEICELRQQEALRGGAHLGLDDYEFCGYPEGHFPGPAEFEVAVARVRGIVEAFQPDIVYAPWIGEYHLDHHVAARVTRAALGEAKFQGTAWGYEVWTPLIAQHIVDISAVIERKTAALGEHKSQLEHTDFIHKALGLSAQRSLYLPKGARHGEAFCDLASD
ncbi:MAG: LmbE family N-acetylglucosaminyl deacetylase [Planctomycetota bacterium]|jgi:LmbE family N-acetylglucosaminyl deacetylase